MGGVQTSLQTLMNTIVYAICMIISQPNKFGFLIIMSACVVTSGHVMYAKFALTCEKVYDEGGVLKQEKVTVEENEALEQGDDESKNHVPACIVTS